MTIFKHDCNKHGHRFEARYSEEPNEILCQRVTKTSGDRNELLLRKYIHDICTYCGKIINQNTKENDK